MPDSLNGYIKEKRTITKLALYLYSMKGVFALGLVLGVIFIFLCIVLFLANVSVFGFLGNTLFSAGVAVFLFFALSAICSPLALRGIYNIASQEDYLGFSFNKEMKKRRITITASVTPDWYIAAGAARVIAFRRDFIVEIGEQGKIGDRGLNQVPVLCADGKTRMVRGFYSDISKFRKWFSRREKV